MHTTTVPTLVLLLGAWSASVLAQPDFASVEQRIRANCYDCAGASEAALRSAVTELGRLVASGFATVETRRLLADSYREIALTYSEQGSREQMELLAQHRETYRDLLADYPDNLDLLRGYARVADDAEIAEKLVMRTSAALAEAHFLSGALLAAKARSDNKQAAARDHLQKAFELATGAEKVAYGRRYTEFLVQVGDSQVAERVRNDVDAYRRLIGL